MPTVRDYLDEQAAVIRASAAPLVPRDLAQLTALWRQHPVHRLVFVGSGTSSFAATAVAPWAERVLPGTSIRITTPTEPLHYWPDAAFGREAIVVAVTQSGRSRMVLDVLARAAATGSRTVIVTGEPARLDVAGVGIDIRAGAEIVGAKTKGYTSTIVTLRLLVAAFAGISPDLGGIAGAVDAALESGRFAEDFARQVDRTEGIAVLGSGPHLATAREAALKIAEIARIDAEAFDVEEYIHGPHRRLTAASSVAVVAVDSPIFDRSVALVRWLGTVTSRVLVITDRPERFAGSEATIVGIQPIGEDLAAVPAIIPLQRLALGCAAAFGIDPEEPLFAEVDSLLSRKDALA